MRLWFGDERGYNATHSSARKYSFSCGLVMKEDITQPVFVEIPKQTGCGLVMKEDITQQERQADLEKAVVVW